MRIFYCWQSNRPDVREFVEGCLGKALAQIALDHTELEVAPDRDTYGVPGAPEVAATILSKISDAAGVVADVTIVNTADARHYCNPNVLVEVGYAFGVLGDSRLLLVMDIEYGDIPSLPFDLRGRRIVPFRRGDDGARSLIADLEHELRLIVEAFRNAPTRPEFRVLEIAINECIERVRQWLPFAERMRRTYIVFRMHAPRLASAALPAAVADAARLSDDLYDALTLVVQYLSDVDAALDVSNGNVGPNASWTDALSAAENAQHYLGLASAMLGKLKAGG